MRLGKVLFCLLSALFFAAALSAQERVAVFPPLAGKGIGDLVRKTVMATFEECLSAPGSGFEVYDREHTDAVLKELGEQRDALYNEASAVEIGGRLGVQCVCISELLKEEGAFLINCKLIDVRTGKARTGRELVDGSGIKEIMDASEKLMNRVLGRGGAAKAAPPAPAVAARPAQTAAVANTVAGNMTATGNITGKIAVVLPLDEWYSKARFATPNTQNLRANVGPMLVETMKSHIIYLGNGLEYADGILPPHKEMSKSSSRWLTKNCTGKYDVWADGYLGLVAQDLDDLRKCREAARQLGADYVIVSKIRELNKYSDLLESRLVDVKSGKVLRAVSETVNDSKDLASHREAAEAIMAKLLAPL